MSLPDAPLRFPTNTCCRDIQGNVRDWRKRYVEFQASSIHYQPQFHLQQLTISGMIKDIELYTSYYLGIVANMRRLLVFIFITLSACVPSATEIPDLPTLAPLPEEVLPIFFWQTETGQLNATGEFDLWQFGAEAGDNIFIRTVSRGVEIRLSLLQGNDVIVEGSNVIELSIPLTEVYRGAGRLC